jgi:ATP-dependent Clp protease ATP-binding subunit ClpA
VFERFTDRARRVVVLAQEEARLLDHNYIGTEHLLLGLIRDGDGVACQALASLGISLPAVRAQVEEIIGRGQTASMGHVPFTPRAKKVLELSLREALQLGHDYIGTEHILLGLIREGKGVGAQVLQKLGADLNRVRQQVIVLLQGETAEEGSARAVLQDDPNEFPRRAADRGRRALAAAERLAAAGGDPSVTPADVVFGFLINEEQLRGLEWLARRLEEPPSGEPVERREPPEGTGEES